MIQRLKPDRQSIQDITIVMTGDIILDEPDPDYWLSGIAPSLQQADLSIGHLEVPHTKSAQVEIGDIPAPGADPRHLEALKKAGFSAMTLAGNHIADCGGQGILDTCVELNNLGVAHCGAGQTLDEARKPAILSSAGRTIAILSYNCVGPESAWAESNKAGCAYLPVETEDNVSVNPRVNIIKPSAEAKEILNQDIASLKKCADFVIVALHKGMVHTPGFIAPYEKDFAYAAIDAGANAVIGHHAHIVRGIEFYRDKPIFHGLGNGCVVTRALSKHQDDPKRSEWAERRKILFGFEPDPEYYLAPFHPEAVNAFMARLVIRADDKIEVGFIPIYVDPPGRPRQANDNETKHICEYLNKINEKANLKKLQINSNSGMITLT